MALFVNTNGLEDPNYSSNPPLSWSQIQSENPNTTFPDARSTPVEVIVSAANSLGYEVAHQRPITYFTGLKTGMKGKEYTITSCTKDDFGLWQRDYTLTPTQGVEQQLEKLRIKRNILLFKSDWSMMEDAPITPEKKEEWKVYRQLLRDITNKYDHGIWVLFPNKPT